MIFYSLYLLLIAIALDRLLRQRTKNTVLQHQFRLYALRDSLRESVMRGDIGQSNWVFQYLDSSIAKSIRVLPNLSLWRVLAMMVIHRPDKAALRRSQEHLRAALRKSENRVLARVYVEYMTEMGFFLLQRHSTLTPLKSVMRAIRAGRALKDAWRRAKEFVTEAPETSTLPEFSC